MRWLVIGGLLGFLWLLGCNSTSAKPPQCVVPCAAPIDCTVGRNIPVERALCSSGTCSWHECLMDTDCQQPSRKCALRPLVGLNACVPTCRSSTDCGTNPKVECVGGGCVDRACTIDAECGPDLDGHTNYVCVADPVSGSRACVRTCVVGGPPSQCWGSTLPDAYNRNTECQSGLCRYLGCSSDQDCTVGDGQVCRAPL